MLIVLAGNRQEFLDWCRENGINHKSREVLYPFTVEDIMGISGIKEFHIIGSWRQRADAFEIRDRVRLRMEMDKEFSKEVNNV
jgi:hypothetical protein